MSDVDNDQDSKTEEPTPKQRERFDERGEVAKSEDVGSAVSIVGGTVMLVLAMNAINTGMVKLSTAAFSRLDAHENSLKLIGFAARQLVVILGPFMLGMAVLVVAGQIAQVGLRFTPKALEFKPEKFNPLPQLKNLFFSGNTVIELLKSLIKVIVIGFLAVRVLVQELHNFGRLATFSTEQVLTRIGEIGLRIVIHVGVGVIAIAIIDLLIARYRHNRKMMMTKQEVKDEYKQQDGDPMLKGKIRARQREMSKKRMLDAVGGADVVVVNPTHYSAAVRYRIGVDAAPVILALGVDDMAARIRERARKKGIPVVSNPPLARALYGKGKVGGYIPADLYSAVAQLLAWVYSITGRVA
jgi:flagellar biosynthetic protein FlhB